MKAIAIDTFQCAAGIGEITVSEDGRQAAFIKSKFESGQQHYVRSLAVYHMKQKKIDWFAGIHPDGICWMDSDTLILTRSIRPNQVEIYTEFWSFHVDTKEISFLCRLPFQAVSVLGKTPGGRFIIKATEDIPIRCRLEGLDPQAREKELERICDEKNRFTVYDEYPYYWNGRGVINGKRTNVFRLDMKTGEALPVFPVGFQISNAVYSAQEDRIAATGYESQRVHMYKEALFTAFGDGKTWKKLIDQEVFRIERLAIWDRRIVMTVNMELPGSGQYTPTRLIWVDSENGCTCNVSNEAMFLGNPVLSDVCPGSGKDFQACGNWLYYVQGKEENSYLMRMDKNGNQEWVAGENGSVFCFDVHADEVYFVAAQKSGFQELYRIGNCKTERITDINGWIAADYIIQQPEPVYFLCDEEIEIHGFVIRPVDYDGSKRYPMILDIHGGPGMAYGTGFMHEMQYWAAQGYFVAFCNPRGSASRGADFLNMFGRFGTGDYDDFMKFTDIVLQRYPAIDPKRIGVTGGSYGGYATNWIIGHTDRFAAAASQRSISNMLTMDGTSHCAGYLCEEWTHTTGWANINQVWALAPLAYAKNVKTPTLFLQSEEDYICPVVEAQQMFTAIIQNGVEAKMVLFKGENHSLSRNGKKVNRIKRLEEITSWMDRFLKK